MYNRVVTKPLVWVYSLKNRPIFQKDIIIPDALKRSNASEKYPQLLIRSVGGSGYLVDLLITDRPLEFLYTDRYKPLILNGSGCWILSPDPLCRFKIRSPKFDENAGDHTRFGGVAFINANTNFLDEFLSGHSELLSYFIRTCFSSNGFSLITSTNNYDYLSALYLERDILRQL